LVAWTLDQFGAWVWELRTSSWALLLGMSASLGERGCQE
jgi:hypothetical protein